MSKQEALEQLRQIGQTYALKGDTCCAEVIKIAIDALEQQIMAEDDLK